MRPKPIYMEPISEYAESPKRCIFESREQRYDAMGIDYVFDSKMRAPATKHPMPPKKELVKMYLSGMLQKEIADFYEVSRPVVCVWFKKLGIKRGQKS